MCGSFNYHAPMRNMHLWSDLISEWPGDVVAGDKFPRSQIAAFMEPSGQSMYWGMVPPFATEFDMGKYSTFNAKIETVHKLPTFRNAWKKAQRCLIPMKGFYEWTGLKGGKLRHFVTDESEGFLVVAGLYDVWIDGSFSCTMVTKEAGPDLADIHHRSPIFLTPSTADEWLTVDVPGAKEMLMAADIETLTHFPAPKSQN